jgi:hypothetical protein
MRVVVAMASAVQPAPMRPRAPMAPAAPSPHAVVQRVQPAYPVAYGSVAYDPGYASIGNVPIVVQARPSWSRPGIVTASGVLAIVLGAFAVIAAIGWLATNDVERTFGGDSHLTVPPVARAITNLLIAVILIVGAPMALSRQAAGRWCIVAGGALSIAYDVVALIDQRGGFRNYWPLMTIFMAIPMITLILLPPATYYFVTKSPEQRVRYA